MPSSTIDQVDAIEIIAGTPPGGGQDRAARALAEAMAVVSGAVATVTNVVGRGGGAAWEAVTNRPSDGTCLAISSPTLVTNSLHDATEVDSESLTHLAILCAEPLVFVVHFDSQMSSADDLIGVIQRGSIQVGIATAIGNINHLAVAAIAKHAGVLGRDVAVCAFGSARDAVRAVIENRATFAVVSAASAIAEIDSRHVRPIAVSASTHPGAPFDDVPLWTEVGVDCEFATWRGVVGPPGMGDGVVETTVAVIAAAVETETWTAATERYVWIPAFLPHDEATQFMSREREQARRALLGLGLLDG